MIVAYHDGNFAWHDLVRPHNHTRPLTYRAIYLANAILTDWDIRSEYFFMYLAILGCFAVHLIGLHRISASKERFLLGALILSIVYFSPAGHNNHWWSMMLQLDLANLFIAAALLAVALSPRSWAFNITSAALCWLAVYTITNGFFAVLSAALVVQLSSPRPLRPDRFTLFWMLNSALLTWSYFPVAEQSSAVHPTILAYAQFVAVYLGSPAGGLLNFPYRGFLDLPTDLTLNTICGVVVLSGIAWLAYRLRSLEVAGARMFVAGSIFAITSALVTGWGRAAFDSYGIANANASRYTIFSSFALFGLIYAWCSATPPFRTSPRWLRAIATLMLCAFCVLAATSYWRSRVVYRSAHDFNAVLAEAFTPSLKHTLSDKFVYPRQDVVDELRAGLLRARSGPYRLYQSLLPSEGLSGDLQYIRPATISGEQSVAQMFSPSHDGLRSCRIQFVTWGNTQSDSTIRWRLFRGAVSESKVVASGSFRSASVTDWGVHEFTFNRIQDSGGQIFSFVLTADGVLDHPIGVPLYRRQREGPLLDLKQPLITDGTSLVANISLGY
jgi:hypothetical protein